MPQTPYPRINALLDSALAQLPPILGARLIGLYLYGSLVTGDFDEDASDIDLLAVTATDITEDEFAALDTLHARLTDQYAEWNNRIEIAYLSAEALRIFKTTRSQIAVISPGEPFHIKDAGRDWLLNWYVIQEHGVALFGPSARTIIAAIAQEEFAAAIKAQAAWWRDHVAHTRDSRPYQAFAIITMCRALYADRNGEEVSKLQAAAWAEGQLPAWAPLIRNALLWRQDHRNGQVDHEATYPETVRFVHYVIDLIVRP